MNPIIEQAREVMRVELDALRATIDSLDERFAEAMRLLREREGKIIVTGVGKSGLIGQKIAATLSSTGSLAVFMHAADGIHGDLGVVARGDVVLALSHSGETEEVLSNMPAFRRIGAKVVALVGNQRSRLARMSDAVIPLVAPREADHLKLAPTSSALACLAVGDAIAALLSKWRGFQAEDFALYHPGGQLGRRLLLLVRDLMIPLERTPMIEPEAGMYEALGVVCKGGIGAVLIVDSLAERLLKGIITDGDLRRAAYRRRDEYFDLCCRDIMTPTPVTIRPEARAEEALRLMEDRPGQITELPVVDEAGRVIGIIRLHDLLQIGFRAEES